MNDFHFYIFLQWCIYGKCVSRDKGKTGGGGGGGTEESKGNDHVTSFHFNEIRCKSWVETG